MATILMLTRWKLKSSGLTIELNESTTNTSTINSEENRLGFFAKNQNSFDDEKRAPLIAPAPSNSENQAQCCVVM